MTLEGPCLVLAGGASTGSKLWGVDEQFGVWVTTNILLFVDARHFQTLEHTTREVVIMLAALVDGVKTKTNEVLLWESSPPAVAP